MAAKAKVVLTTASILIILYVSLFAILHRSGKLNGDHSETRKLNHDVMKTQRKLILHRDRRDENVFMNQDDNKAHRYFTDENANSIQDSENKAQHFLTDESDKGGTNIFSKELPIIYAITPTYKRLNQIPELTRLANTLKNVESLHWIVIEEGNSTLPEVNSLLLNSGIRFTYLNAKPYRNVSRTLKGIHQRNKGIFWLRKNIDMSKDGVVYFADDDNTFALKLFDEMRYTKKVSVWPVGFVSGRKYQTPIVKNGKIVKFDSWNTDRKFGVDMAGFALNTKMFFFNPHLYFWKTFKKGYQETMFLELCCRIVDLEPKADNCTKVLVWHTKALDPIITHNSYNDSDLMEIQSESTESKENEKHEQQKPKGSHRNSEKRTKD